MNKINVCFGMLILIIGFSCQQNDHCTSKDVSVKMKLYEYGGRQKLCIQILNNSDNDIYLTDISGLLFGLNVEKRFEGIEKDARFEFYRAVYSFGNSESDLLSKQRSDNSEERKICNVHNYGPSDNVGFDDTLAKTLIEFVPQEFYFFAGKEVGDTIALLKSVMDCIFIPKHSIISDGIYICEESISYDELSIQFYYPNTNLDEFNLWNGGNGNILRKEIDATQIKYPDTLLGFIRYRTPITSQIIELSK